MPSVVELLEQRELTARRRMDELREEADRIHAELAVAERERSEWVIARSHVGEVLAPDDGDADGPDTSMDLPDCGESRPSRARDRPGPPEISEWEEPGQHLPLRIRKLMPTHHTRHDLSSVDQL